MKVIIDVREKKLITELQKNKPEFKFEIKMLDLGDIIFEVDENKLLLIIERKTINDLISSIKDGRYKEQKCRLLNMREQKKTHLITYIIEGDLSVLEGKDKEISLFWGSWISMIYRDNIPLIRTQSLKETVDFLHRFYERSIKGNGSEFINQISSSQTIQSSNVKEIQLDYSNNIKITKKGNVTPELCQILILSTIPGISKVTADVIIYEYKSVKNICNKYDELETEEEKMVMVANLKNPKNNRKIGNAASKKIYEYLNYTN
jgi:crossover junction endonuclease MUS81